MAQLHAFEDPKRRCLKVADWPAGDRAAWEQLLLPGDILDGTVGLGHHWSPDTIKMRRKGYGRWLNFLRCNGALDVASKPELRVTPERLRAYLADLASDGIAPWTLWGRIAQLLAVMQAMAPESDWTWLRGVVDRLQRRVVDKKDKRYCIRPAHEIVTWGYREMDAMLKSPPLRDAETRYRDALMIALLICCPTMRLRNLHMIRIDTHLLEHSDGYRLVFAPDETKTGNPIAIPVPASLQSYMRHYLDFVRPELAECESDRLWIARHGGPMTQKAVYYQIIRTTKRAFGKSINPHNFRHCAATTVAIDDPEHIGIAAPLLGHTELRTTEKHYIQANSIIAGRHLRASVDSLRLKLQPRQKHRAKGEIR